MTILQLLEAIGADYVSYDAGSPVTIQFDDINTKGGFHVGFTPGSLNITLPNGDSFNTPLANDEIENLPLLADVLITAGQQSIILQKEPAGG